MEQKDTGGVGQENINEKSVSQANEPSGAAQPEQPEQSGQSAQPERSEKPEKSEKPKKPEKSAKRGGKAKSKFLILGVVAGVAMVIAGVVLLILAAGSQSGNGPKGSNDSVTAVLTSEMVPTPVYFSDGLVPIRYDGKYGYMDADGEVVIDFQYDDAKSFSEGMAVVEVDGKCGYINTKGEVIVEINNTNCDSFSEGLAAVVSDTKKNGKKGTRRQFVDKTGEIVIELTFDTTTPFSDGLARYGINYIDKEGNVAFSIDPFEATADFRDGLAFVVSRASEGEVRYAFVDTSGSIAFEVPDWILFTGDLSTVEYSEGLVATMLVEVVDGNTQYTPVYLNKSGEVALSLAGREVSRAGKFSEGLAAVSKQDLIEVEGGDTFVAACGYIDKDGNEVVGINEYASCTDFSEGYAAVQVKTDGGEEWKYINTEGKVASDQSYKKAYSFQDGYALVEISNDNYAFINKDFEIMFGGE